MYHWKNSRVNISMDEPVYTTLWVARFVLPPPLRAIYSSELLVEQITKISGLDVDKLPSLVEQTYRNTSREFMGTVVDTKIEFDTSFEVNVDPDGNMYPLNVIKAWAKLIWDNNTAAQSLKRDYAGSLTAELHTKSGEVIRRYECGIVFPTTPPGSIDLEYNSENIYKLDISWKAENVTDLIRSSQ